MGVYTNQNKRSSKPISETSSIGFKPIGVYKAGQTLIEANQQKTIVHSPV
jgi:hypothetical protein